MSHQWSPGAVPGYQTHLNVCDYITEAPGLLPMPSHTGKWAPPFSPLLALASIALASMALVPWPSGSDWSASLEPHP